MPNKHTEASIRQMIKRDYPGTVIDIYSVHGTWMIILTDKKDEAIATVNVTKMGAVLVDWADTAAMRKWAYS